MPRTAAMTASSVKQRAGAAREFLQVAEERVEFMAARVEAAAEAQIAASNAINAGIAAADAICGAVLGLRSSERDHRTANDLLGTVLPGGSRLATRLRRLLKDKSQLQYGDYCTPAVARKMTNDARVLVDAMADYKIR